MVATAQDRCNSILEHVRSTNLNFLSQETSFSIYLTIRKTLVKNVPDPYPHIQLSNREHIPAETKAVLEAEISQLKATLYQRESEKNDLIKLYEGETLEAEELKKQLDETTNALENIDANYAKLEAKLKDLEKSKKLLEKKHENTCKEFKAVKDENDDMKKDLSMCDIKLKTMKKESKERESQHYKTLKVKDDAIENLKKFKAAKDAQERDLKVKQKRINKKLRSLEERESKLMKKVPYNNIPNNNDIPELLTNSCSPFPNILPTRTVDTMTITADSTLCPSSMTHWLSPVRLACHGDFFSFVPHRVSVSQNPPSESFFDRSSATSEEQVSNMKCEKCGYKSREEKGFNAHAEAHKKMDNYLEELKVGPKVILENVPEADQVFTVEEITTFGLDWNQFERILEIMKEAY